MAEFKHGIYGDMGEDIISSSKSASIYYAFLGTVPVNLIRLEKNKEGSLPKYKDMGYVNSPMKLVDSSAKSAVGYSADWKHFSLCEVIKAFFCNTKGGVGPVFAINVLDPDTDRKSEVTTKTFEIANKRIEFVSDTIILDTLELEKVGEGDVAGTLVEGTDYNLSYNYDSNKVTIEFLAEEISGSVAASYYEVDTSFMDSDETKAERLIGSLQEDGSATGIYALRKIFNDYGVHPSVLGAPGFMHINKVYNTLVSEGKTINDKFHNVIFSDIPTTEVESVVNTIKKAVAWKKDNGRTAENAVSVWLKGMDSEGNVYHGSTIAAVEQLRVDVKNDAIPFEVYDNKSVTWITKLCLDADNIVTPYSEKQVNQLNEAGITSFNVWKGTILLWGNGTDAFVYNGVYDLRARFSSNMRMQYYLLNDFIMRRHEDIGDPMFLSKKNDIIREEQERLEKLVALGALIGEPHFVFNTSKNASGDVAEGNFRFDIDDTPTPPINSLTLVVSYTDAGTSVYFEE